MKMRAISIRQPWAWLITRPDITDPVKRAKAITAGILKDIENRPWKTKYCGPVLIHAGKTMTMQAYHDVDYFLNEADALDVLDIELPPASRLDRGGIVGYAEITDCLSASPSPWFMGEYGFVLKNQTPLPFLPCNGALSFFTVDVPDDYLGGVPGRQSPPSIYGNFKFASSAESADYGTASFVATTPGAPT